MNQMYDFKKIKVGQTIEGTVLRVDANEVVVDFGYITEGTMYLNQLTTKNVQSAKEIVKEGDPITAVIRKINHGDEEQVLLSRIPIEMEENIERIREAQKAREFVTVKVTEDKKNVLIVKLFGVEGIMPKSEVDVDQSFDAATLVGKEVTVKIIELSRDRRGQRLVVSRKAVQLKDLYEERVKNFEAIELDASYEGEVVRIEPYGVLVVANNYQGLVPYREISHLPFKDITDVLNVGDKVNVKVMDKNESKLQVVYSIKALLLKPWQVLDKELNVGDEIEGEVVRLTDFGAFVNIAPLVDGLLHVSEYSHNPFVNLLDEVKEGQTIKTRVLSIDANRERLSLSVKALKENPWTTCGLKRFDIVPVKVVGFTEQDAIVEFVEDVQGILPRNQISSEKRVNNANDELNVGQEVQVKVTEFDANNKVLNVSIRRIKEDEERQEFKKFMKEQENMKNDTLGDLLGEQLREVLKRK
jgi:small subunit ribosomal protein S1